MPRRKAVNEMKKLYEKNELLFAILWIVVYCAASIPIRGSLGDESLAMVIELAVIAAGILVFVKKFNLGQHRTENCVQKMSLRGKIKT